MRNEEYRRAVAALPCVCCGLENHSQAAHANGLEYGKGMGIKADDMAIFPLCADRPGVRGCHSAFDSGALFSKAERREVTQRWISWTRAAVANERDTLPPEQIDEFGALYRRTWGDGP